MTNKLQLRQGYEKPLHYPCTIMVKAKPNKSIDKRLYCDIFSIYFKREKEWDMSILKDNIEWWCYATDLERYIKQSQKDLKILKEALLDAKQTLFYCWDDYNIIAAKCTAENIEKVLEQINEKENETSQNQNA